MELEDYFTLADAAKLLAVSKAQVSRLVAAGRIEAARVGPMVLVNRESTAKYKATRRKPGRPPAPTKPAKRKRG